MVIRNWGPDGIARIARAAVHRAYRRMIRADCPGEAERMYRWFSDQYRRDMAELIVANLGPQVTAAPARQIIRELSGGVIRRHLQAEIGSRKRRGAK